MSGGLSIGGEAQRHQPVELFLDHQGPENGPEKRRIHQIPHLETSGHKMPECHRRKRDTVIPHINIPDKITEEDYSEGRKSGHWIQPEAAAFQEGKGTSGAAQGDRNDKSGNQKKDPHAHCSKVDP